jgi:hypothetical protein
MTADAVAELLSEQAKRERAKAGGAEGGDATPEQKVERAERLEAHAAPKLSEPKERSRTKAARSGWRGRPLFFDGERLSTPFPGQ